MDLNKRRLQKSSLTLSLSHLSFSSIPKQHSPIAESMPQCIDFQETIFPLEDLEAVWAAFSDGQEMPKDYHFSNLNNLVEASDGMQSGMSIEALRIWKGTQYQDVLRKKARGSEMSLYQLIDTEANKSQVQGILPLYGVKIVDNPSDFSSCMMPMIKGGNIKKYFPIIQNCLQGDHEALRQGAFWFLLECVSQVSNTLSFLHTTAFNDSGISYATLKDSGLEHLQESREPSQMVHCDLKPTNILFEDMQFKLIDFGTSRTTARLLKEDFAYEGGSARYFSPVRWVCLADEHLSAVLGKDKKTILGSINPTSYDIWALGLVLAEAMGIDSFRLLSIEEHDRIETICISSEYLAGRKKIVINKERDRWFAAWKNTTDLVGAGDTNAPVDIQELSEQMPSYAGLAALLQKMLSVESQVIDDPCVKHHPITAAEISIQCKSMIHQQGLVENQKEKFVGYLQAETKDHSPVFSKGWMI